MGPSFPLFGFVEAFESAVRWDRKGLYRSRWGNYDLVLTDGLFTLSEGLAGADILASRLQGQDVLRSGFFDVVRDRLGWSAAGGGNGPPQRYPGESRLNAPGLVAIVKHHPSRCQNRKAGQVRYW